MLVTAIFYPFLNRFHFFESNLYVIHKCFHFGQVINFFFVWKRSIWSKMRLNHKVVWSFYMQINYLKQKKLKFFLGQPYICICISTFPNQPWLFTWLQYQSFENTVGKWEIGCNEQFLLFPWCFLSSWRIVCLFHQIWNCYLQTLSVWMIVKFTVWEWDETPVHRAWFRTCIYIFLFL